MLVGFWLGLAQVSLGFAILTGSGAMITHFFILTGCWLGGGIIGAFFLHRALTLLFPTALIGVVIGQTILREMPFMFTTQLIGFAAGGITGTFAGAYLTNRALVWEEVRRLLFYENNGFIIGWAAATCMLLSYSKALSICTNALGGVLVIVFYTLRLPTKT